MHGGHTRREIITALAITDSWASGRPWWRRSLSRYSLCAHCDKMNWMCESILKLDWKITPNSLQQSNCSISSGGWGIWKYCTLGRLNTISFVLERFRLRQFVAAQAFTFCILYKPAIGQLARRSWTVIDNEPNISVKLKQNITKILAKLLVDNILQK